MTITTPEQMREAAASDNDLIRRGDVLAIKMLGMTVSSIERAIRAIPIAPQPDFHTVSVRADTVTRVCGICDIADCETHRPAPQPVAVTVKPLDSLRAEHAEWSQRQFGNVSAIGPAKHLAKEALEVADAPSDVIEHADCWMLLWDMQRRAGISDADLAAAISQKLSINKARVWPAPKEGEAREHNRDEAALTIHPADPLSDPRVVALVGAAKWIGVCANTTGGVAGPDSFLMDAVERLSAALRAIGGEA